ncbi:MAG: DUF3012 domain-containing protein [Gammaproteobacteria bacterium]|nr:DUF3012 domain-containing protein [Gammaproteobacteria bacterium]
MSIVKKVIYAGFSLVCLVMISACSPEIGSEKWCENIKEKPKADWSTNDAANFTKHCILK